MSLARRLAVTVAVPTALYFAGEHLLLPGIDESALRGSHVSHANLGVLAPGIAPILSAYWMVEVIAFLVPRWSRLRHGNPEGRAKLDRAARVLALLLAAFQGFGVAMQLKALAAPSLSGGDAFDISVPLVTLSLVGGVCLQFVAARFVTQRGLGNGFVVLLGARQLVTLGQEALEAVGLRPSSTRQLTPTTPREIGFTLAALALGVFATWLVL
jgi:preprotein translocase subunit SecY